MVVVGAGGSSVGAHDTIQRRWWAPIVAAMTVAAVLAKLQYHRRSETRRRRLATREAAAEFIYIVVYLFVNPTTPTVPPEGRVRGNAIRTCPSRGPVVLKG